MSGKKYEYETADATNALIDRFLDVEAQNGRASAEIDIGRATMDGALGDSPIEETMVMALLLVARMNDCPVHVAYHDGERQRTVYARDGSWGPYCLQLALQAPVGKYRCDILVSRVGVVAGYETDVKDPLNHVVVECDGTAFHERSEPERRYEKARDRWMTSMGLRVARFTGKEILDESQRCAVEVIDLLNFYIETRSDAEWLEIYGDES